MCGGNTDTANGKKFHHVHNQDCDTEVYFEH
jgi:hypothetical protein